MCEMYKNLKLKVSPRTYEPADNTCGFYSESHGAPAVLKAAQEVSPRVEGGGEGGDLAGNRTPSVS